MIQRFKGKTSLSLPVLLVYGKNQEEPLLEGRLGQIPGIVLYSLSGGLDAYEQFLYDRAVARVRERLIESIKGREHCSSGYTNRW